MIVSTANIPIQVSLYSETEKDLEDQATGKNSVLIASDIIKVEPMLHHLDERELLQ
jgi:hypothetical protein